MTMLDLPAISDRARELAWERARLMWPPQREDKIAEQAARLFHRYYWAMVSPYPVRRIGGR